MYVCTYVCMHVRVQICIGVVCVCAATIIIFKLNVLFFPVQLYDVCKTKHQFVEQRFIFDN